MTSLECTYLYGYNICVYTSLLHFLIGPNLNGLQGLCQWRDVVARAEDESTGYIMPNKTLLEIGKNYSNFLLT